MNVYFLKLLYKKFTILFFFCILQALHTPYVQLVDNFAKPVMCLLGDVIQWFVENGVDYEPESIYSDVRVSIFFVPIKSIHMYL